MLRDGKWPYVVREMAEQAFSYFDKFGFKRT